MRPANYTPYTPVTPKTVIPVTFHKWTEEPFQEQVHLNNGGGWIWVHHPMAIVEFADGHCETVPVGSIVFTDKENTNDLIYSS